MVSQMIPANLDWGDDGEHEGVNVTLLDINDMRVHLWVQRGKDEGQDFEVTFDRSDLDVALRNLDRQQRAR